MNARRIFTAAALGLALSGAACSGESPTLTQEEETRIVPGDAAPTDTAGFMPPPSS